MGHQEIPAADATVRPDSFREARTGVPEVIQVAGKDMETLVVVAQELLDRSGRAILSRARPVVVRQLRDRFPRAVVEEYPVARMAVVRANSYARVSSGGRVALVTAGSSDVPVIEEARVMAEEMGCETMSAYDVGVAGLHRLVGPLREILEARVDAVVVAAGMDGALPS